MDILFHSHLFFDIFLTIYFTTILEVLEVLKILEVLKRGNGRPTDKAQMPRDLRAHGSPQPEPRLLPSDPYTSPRGGDAARERIPRVLSTILPASIKRPSEAPCAGPLTAPPLLARRWRRFRPMVLGRIRPIQSCDRLRNGALVGKVNVPDPHCGVCRGANSCPLCPCGCSGGFLAP